MLFWTTSSGIHWQISDKYNISYAYISFVLSRNCISLLFGSTHDVASRIHWIDSSQVIMCILMSANSTTHLKSVHWRTVIARSTHKIASLCIHCHSWTAQSNITDKLQKMPSHTNDTRSRSLTIYLFKWPAHSKATLDITWRSLVLFCFFWLEMHLKWWQVYPSLSLFKSCLRIYLLCSVYKDWTFHFNRRAYWPC